MREIGVIRRIDHLGRIVIPKEIRKQIFGNFDCEGTPVEVFIDGNSIIIKSYSNDENINL